MHALAQPRQAAWTAMFCAAGVTAQFIAGKATRDALYLANLDVKSLPAMVVVTAMVSIGLAVLMSKGLRHVSPGALVSIAFSANAALLLADWLLVSSAPRMAAVLVYLQTSGVGPLFGSGFWLIAGERFDPHTSRQRFGRIAAASTFGGLVGGLIAERVGASFGIAATLPMLAIGNLYCAWMIRKFAAPSGPAAAAQISDLTPDLAPKPPLSGLRVILEASYLRNLAALVLLGTCGAALVDYLFKAQAVVAYGQGEELLRFFAIYYSATSLITFALQASSSGWLLRRLDLGASASSPLVAVAAGSIGAILAPGLTSLVIARGAETVCRGAWFRSAYEVFYTPLPLSEKRSAKSFIDVGVDRFGEALGGGVVQIVLLLLPLASRDAAILSIAIACSGLAAFTAMRLQRGYIEALRRWLLPRAAIVGLDTSNFTDRTTKTVVLTVQTQLSRTGGINPDGTPKQGGAALQFDPGAADIPDLQSADRDRVTTILQRRERLSGLLVAYVIPLLGWDAVSEAAVLALRRVAGERVGQLVDALLDSSQPVVVRRRLAKVLAACASQRAADGLVLGLDDQRFEVRFQCGRSLVALAESGALGRVESVTIYAVILRELEVERKIRKLREPPVPLKEASDLFSIDESRNVRASHALEHIFTLLSLVHPGKSMRSVYRALIGGDEGTRGTALEYLKATLPPMVRARLWLLLGESSSDDS